MNVEPGRTALVVLNWNGRADLLRCLGSLRTHEPDVDIIVVDNASSDGSAEAVRDAYPSSTLIEAPRNLGFSAGNNLGITHALESGAEYIGILNNDTVFIEPFLGPLVAAASQDPFRTYVSPEIRYLATPDKVWFAGSEVDLCTGIYVHSSVAAGRSGVSSTPTVTGCALLAHRAVWQHVGLLDETYFLIFEDTEWCVRSAGRGIRGLVVHDSVILHAVSSTINAHSSVDATYYYVRNGIRFLRRSSLVRAAHPWKFVLQVASDHVRRLIRHRSRQQVSALRALAVGVVHGYSDRGGKR